MKTLIQSPLDDAFVQNPYALYARILADDPIQYWQDYDMVSVFDAKTVNALLRDRRLGRARPAGQTAPPRPHLSAFDALEAHSMLDLEPPRHTRLRGLVLRAFTSRRIAALAPDIDDICTVLLDGFAPREVDIIPAYCTQVPVRIIARLLGVPEEMGDQLLDWSNKMVAMYQAGVTPQIEAAANAAAAEFTDFLRGHINARRNDPADDLITHLIAAEDDGARLSPDEMIGTCVLLLNAGHEATVHTLGNGVHALLTHGIDPAWHAPAHIDNTVEEILRYDPPLHMFTRYAYADIEIGGHKIRSGQQIALMLGAVGRDPRAHTAPDHFDPFRKRPAHAAFGGGIHFCVGAPLARLELQVALRALWRRHPHLRLARPAKYANAYHFHGLTSLYVGGLAP